MRDRKQHVGRKIARMRKKEKGWCQKSYALNFCICKSENPKFLVEEKTPNDTGGGDVCQLAECLMHAFIPEKGVRV